MIELSKCPNCAEDDRVTIAGKEFCMRCGTPAEDNAKMGVDTTTGAAQAIPANNTQNTNSQPLASNSITMDAATNASVQKFNAPMSAGDQVVEQKTSVGPFIAPPRMQPADSATANNTSASAASPPAVEQSAIPTAESDTEAAQPQYSTVMTPTMGTMSLDKRAGVLSDDQFDQLNRSVGSDLSIQNTSAMPQTPTQPQNVGSSIAPTASPIVNGVAAPPPPALLPAENSNQNQSPSKIAMSTDIYSDNIDQSESENLDSNFQKTTLKNEYNGASKNASKIAKPAAIAVSIALLFGTGAYIWKMNYPSLAFKIASAKAGMSASMPGYVPTGYNLGGQIQTNPGTVSYNLINSNSADKKISITQTKTDWDSQALAENYVAPKVENYLALQAQGLTIYVMGQNQATWVNKGTWYNVESKSQPLNQDQIIKIATSL